MDNPTIKIIRDFWDAVPCNSRHGKSPEGTAEYFNEVTEKRYFVESHIPNFADFEKYKGLKVLEIGCGIGTDAEQFVRAGAHYTGIELSSKSLDLATKRFSLFNLPGTFIEGNAEELDAMLGDEKFDLIYSFGVIHHSEFPELIVEQMKNHLEPDGEIKVLLYAQNSWKNMMIDVGMAQPEAQDNCPKALTYSMNEVRTLFYEYEVNIEQTFVFPWKIPEYKNNEYVKEEVFEQMTDEQFSNFEKSLGWHLLITGFLKGEK